MNDNTIPTIQRLRLGITLLSYSKELVPLKSIRVQEKNERVR